MPRRGLLSGSPDALALLKLASEIPQDSFPALKDAATSALSIIETITTFASNIKKGRWSKKYKEECASCAQYVENAVTNVMRSLESQDPAEVEDVRERMNELLESLEKVKGEISGMQQASLLGRLPSSGKDRQSIADMKTQVHATLTPFSPLLGTTNTIDGMDMEQLLASIIEKYTSTTIVARSVNHGSQRVQGNRNPSGQANELAIVRFDGTRPVGERSLNPTGSASVTNQSASVSRSTNKLAVAQPVIFNTTATSGAIVTNVAGDYNIYGPDDKQLVLDKLAFAEGASWDPKLVCLPGTRANILSVIHAWSRSLDAQNIFWLNGVAGAGKSAIAHTVAQALHKDGLLASSFFFNRNDASRNTPRLLVTTIARGIAVRHPAIAADISAALEEDPSLASAPLSRQFEAFISGPLRSHPVNHPIVVVIDALDETIDEDSETSLLTILREEASQFPSQLRIIVTSRPTWVIQQYLSKQAHVISHPIDIHSLDNRQDIAAFVDVQLRDPILRSRMGPNWPEEAVIMEFKNLAEGLFIWIATICRYLRSAYNPRAKLDALLSKSIAQGLPPSVKMDVLYASILALCADWEDADFLADYQLVMGAIMAAKKPLSLIALKALHGGSHAMELSADLLLERFGSVLVGFKTDHEPIHMLHLSFREFITKRAVDAEHTRKFHISEKVHSGRLGEMCIHTMVREFADGKISGTGYLGRDNDDPPGIPEVTGVSEQLLYSCESWNDHISDVTEPNPAILQHLRAFVPNCITIWMEVISSKSIFPGLLSALLWLKDHAPDIGELCDNESQASKLSSLSIRLSYAGRHEEALAADLEVVDLHRALVAERPAVFKAYLATSLNNLSNRLSTVGRTEEALMVVQEAVDLYRTLAAEYPAMFNADLAGSLNNISNRLSAVGRTEEALKVDQEAVDLYWTVVAERPAVFNSDLARSLNNLSARLSAVGRTEGALTVIQEAVDMYRTLVAGRPAVFSADFATSLNSLSVYLAAVGRTEEALMVIQEAVALRRALAAERPAVFNANLAKSLNNLSNRLSTVGRTEEALMVVQEAVDLYRTLAAEYPAMFSADFATSLTNCSTCLSAVGRTEEALMVVREAVALHRALVAERPAVFTADLAKSLTSISISLSAVGRAGEALTAVQEAVDLYRTLVAGRPAVFNAYLAASLNSLSVCLTAVGRMEEALTVIQEAVALRRALAAERPAVFNADLASSLYNLCIHSSNRGRTEEAATAAQESVDLYQILAAERPGLYNVKLANSLQWLSHVTRNV